ncbi:MAG TPA: hypothetical protein VLA19_25495 [Herpetosiphonaceae bacterium]|nr:hypothetical protein [Herpetosiphonaceae bacterium]
MSEVATKVVFTLALDYDKSTFVNADVADGSVSSINCEAQVGFVVALT